MTNFVTKAVVYNPDGTLFYREEHEWTNLTPEMQAWFDDKLTKHEAYLKELKANEKKTPDAIYSAVLSRTGQPDLTFEGFTFDSFQKAEKAWHRIGDELIKMGEQKVKGKS